jgi:methylated-DNA-[protein]-cysteine S-methyltransferase
MQLSFDHFPSPLGELLVAWDAAGLRALDFDSHEDRFHRLLERYYGAVELTRAALPDAYRRPLEAYFRGDLTAIDSIPVASTGTPFQMQVWAALREIPAGRTETYGELARRIGRPGASRAVGLANGANPVGLVVPCHRVIGAGGALTGYGGGLDRKRWLLEHERALPASPALY